MAREVPLIVWVAAASLSQATTLGGDPPAGGHLPGSLGAAPGFSGGRNQAGVKGRVGRLTSAIQQP